MSINNAYPTRTRYHNDDTDKRNFFQRIMNTQLIKFPF